MPFFIKGMDAIQHQELTESYCFLSVQRKDWCIRHGIGNLASQLPGWLSQQKVSSILFGTKGWSTVLDCEHYYGPFLWAPEFANVHTIFPFEEVPINIDGEEYAGPEQYFQQMKSVGQPDHIDVCNKMKDATPEEAWLIGRKHSLRSDWEHVKDNIMKKAVFAKFSGNSYVQKLLRATGDHPLVQIKPSDGYWGTGPNNDGENMLGEILKEVRHLIQQS